MKDIYASSDRPKWQKQRSLRNKSVALVIIAIMSLGGLFAVSLPSVAAKVNSVSTSSLSSTPISAVRFGPSLAIPRTNTGSGKTAAAPGLCTTAPCPMGVVEYGVTPSLGTYSYNAKDVQGFLDVAALDIGTASGGGCLDPQANAANPGVCFTVQLNWIDKLVDGRNKVGNYWAQNIPEIAFDGSCPIAGTGCVAGTYSVTFLDNIWNFSSSKGICTSGQGCMQSGFTGNQEGACVLTDGYPDFYYCVSQTIYDILPPFTIWAFMTTGPSTSGSFGPCTGTTVSCIGFYGSVIENNVGLGLGYYDGVKFSATTTTSANFHIAGTGHSPLGLPFDGEWVAGGPGGGSTNAAYLPGTWQEMYSATGSTFVSIKHAWSSGSNTAESISDVQMFGFFGDRDSATSAFAADNPQISLW